MSKFNIIADNKIEIIKHDLQGPSLNKLVYGLCNMPASSIIRCTLKDKSNLNVRSFNVLRELTTSNKFLRIECGRLGIESVPFTLERLRGIYDRNDDMQISIYNEGRVYISYCVDTPLPDAIILHLGSSNE